MKRVWSFGLLLACACATTSGTQLAANTAGEREVRCRRIGTLARVIDVEGRNTVLDETQTMGPTRVIWLHPTSAPIIRTVEGDVYRCDAPL
jgi:hypothetical protein